MTPLPVARKTLEGGGEPEGIESERCEPWDQPVHRIVEARRFVRNQTGDLGGGRIACFGLSGDGQRPTAYCCDRLAGLVVQLVRDQPPLLFHSLVRQRRHLAPFLQAGLPRAGPALSPPLVPARPLRSGV